MKNEPSGAYYDYTITMKPERPWLDIQPVAGNYFDWL